MNKKIFTCILTICHIPVLPCSATVNQLLSPTRQIQPSEFYYHAGDYYYYQGNKIPLQRSLTEYVVKFRPEITEDAKRGIVESLSIRHQPADIHPLPAGNTAIVKFVQTQQSNTLETTLQTLTQRQDVKFAVPLYVHVESGTAIVSSDELVVKLKPGQAITDFIHSQPLELLENVWGSQDEYVLRVTDPKHYPALAVANQLTESGAVAWAQPNFIQRYQKSYQPNDPLLSDQWYLTGKYRNTSTAQIDAPGAWDLEQGSRNITIAILDDGVQADHPDLMENLYTNPYEKNDGIDNDQNGYVDDLHGWDFVDQDNDPQPASSLDNHGTAVAGIAAARGDNGEGITGVCPYCSILPIKIAKGETFIADADIASALRYAAQRADILSNSWGGGAPSPVLRSAIQYATQQGRGGKGSVVLAAAGNGATGYRLMSLDLPAGTHRFEWSYTKDNNGLRQGEDSAWLAWALFPGSSFINFGKTPADWYTSDSSPWQVIQDPLHADEGICSTTSVQAGNVNGHRVSTLGTVKTISAGTLFYYAWVSSEQDHDGLRLRVDVNNDGSWDKESDLQSGVPAIATGISYPAAFPEVIAVGASTDFDCRAPYSQIGHALDLVAPSGGGPFNFRILATDRTGDAGYVKENYFSFFSGTSATSPLAAGVVGLMLSRNPALTATQARQILRETADKIGPTPYNPRGRNKYYGYGRVNAYHAVLNASP